MTDPDSCEGERIRVVGYVSHGIDGLLVSPSREDVDQPHSRFSLPLDFSPAADIRSLSGEAAKADALAGRYVELVGVVSRISTDDGTLPHRTLDARFAQEKSPLAAADSLFENAVALEGIDEVPYYAPAASAYQVALELGGEEVPSGLQRVPLRLGISLAKLGRHDDAIASYRRVLDSDNPRSEFRRALYLTAESLFAQGDYETALAALEKAERDHPLPAFCGTCWRSHRRDYVVRVGILNEYLGRYETAIESYLSAGGVPVHLRLLELYEASDQLADFLEIVRESDQLHEKRLAKYERPRERSPLSKTVHRVLRIRELAAARDWTALQRIVEPDRGKRSPWFEVELAARVLAEHTDETLPLLLAAFPRNDANNIPFGRAYALGLTKAPEAIALLKTEIERRKNVHALKDLVYALGVAGEEGERALRELATTAGHDSRLAIERNPRRKSPGESAMELPFPFPEVSSSSSLPTACTRQSGSDAYTCTSESSNSFDLPCVEHRALSLSVSPSPESGLLSRRLESTIDG